ncbi:hypothetical protein ES705_39187 [subsurface metagenome]
MTIYPIPAAPLAEDVVVCENEEVPYLTATGENIQWYSDTELANLIHSGNNYSTGQTLAGVYTYFTTQTIEDCEGPADTVQLIIYEIPSSPVASDVNVCEGTSIPDLLASGNNIQWYSDIDLLNLIHSGNVFVTGHVRPGTYTYYITQTIHDCEGLSDSVTLTINPMPAKPDGIDVAVCENDEIIDLYASGENIRWYEDIDLTNLIHSGNEFETGKIHPGEYLYYVTQTILYCESPPDSVCLIINAMPKVDLGPDTTITSQQNITLGVDNEDYSCLWSNGSTSASIEIAGSDLGVGDHDYWVIVMDSTSCTHSDTVMVSVIFTSSVQFTGTSNLVHIYPNPAVDIVHISLDVNESQDLLIKIIDQMGREVYLYRYQPGFENSMIEIDISSLPKGVYVIQIVGNEYYFSDRMILL